MTGCDVTTIATRHVAFFVLKWLAGSYLAFDALHIGRATKECEREQQHNVSHSSSPKDVAGL
jgi:threonine/homoserine/homoserine lactone efflux protein